MPTSQIPNTTKTLSTTHPPPSLPEPLPCPRCDSTNTKFCYYNNYNLSQPRHFCKSCRRYWTHGGSLRNIPVGGSSRKASKPRRSSSSSTSTVTSTASSSATSTSFLSIDAPPPQPPENCLNLNENMHENDQNASFMSLLSSQVVVPGYGFGSGLGFGLCEMGIGMWPYNVGNDQNGGSGGIGVGDTWHEEGISCKEDGRNNNGLVVDEESCGYYGWPELAIATPGTSLK